MPNKVHYFCKKIFKGVGSTYFFENHCVRVLEGDPRIADLYKKFYTVGHEYEITYGPGSPSYYDMEWEKKQVAEQDYRLSGRHAGNVVIVEEKDMR